MEGFFASLRSEEAAHGVRTQIAAPSFVATNIGQADRADDGIVRPGSASDGVDYMTPGDAADMILKGVAQGRDFIPVGRIARLSWWIMRASPRLYARLMRRSISGEG
jgi:short-subunit dehydrogenase